MIITVLLCCALAVSIFKLVGTLKAYLLAKVRYGRNKLLRVGNLRINSNSKVISRCEIECILSQLPGEITHLNVDINIMSSSFDRLRYLEFRSPAIAAFYPSCNLINIHDSLFLDMSEQVSPENPRAFAKIYLLLTLIHELRHKQQSLSHMEEMMTINHGSREEYKNHWTEVDANEYALQIINVELKDLIMNFLEVDNYKISIE